MEVYRRVYGLRFTEEFTGYGLQFTGEFTVYGLQFTVYWRGDYFLTEEQNFEDAIKGCPPLR